MQGCWGQYPNQQHRLRSLVRKGVITNPPVNEEPMTSQDEDGMSSFKKKKKRKKAGSVEGEGK